MTLKVWLKPNGDIERFEISDAEAEPEIQQAVKAALDNMPGMREVIPEGLPQPIKMRFGARKMG